MSGPRLPMGFGTIPAPLPPQEAGNYGERMVKALERLADRVAPPLKWQRVNLVLGVTISGVTTPEQQQDTFDRDVFNLMTVTLTQGELYVWFGMRDNGDPDLRFTPGDTRQVQLPPNTYEFTWKDNSAGGTRAVVYLGAS